MLKVRLYRPFDVAALRRRAAAERARDRRARPHQGAGRDRRAALSRRASRRCTRPGRRARGRRVAADRRRRPLRPVVEGVHARRGARGVRRARRGAAAQPFHRRHRRRRHARLAAARPGLRHRAATTASGRCSTASGADGTVGANKNSIKIIGEEHRLLRAGLLRLRLEEVGRGDDLAPALRPAPDPLRLPDRAGQLRRLPPVRLSRPLRRARDPASPAASSCSTRRIGPEARSGTTCRARCRRRWSRSGRASTSSTPTRVARAAGLGGRINTIMQTCFFAIAGVLPRDEAIARIKEAIDKTYGKRGPLVVEQNFAAVDADAGASARGRAAGAARPRRAARPPMVAAEAPDFVQRVTAVMLADKGDALPVSAFPVDGTWPTGTAKWEKRNLALEIPVWDPALCIQCNKCALVCPHAAIRAKVYDGAALAGAPATLRLDARTAPPICKGLTYTIQVAPEDCTGCHLCVVVCPAKDKANPRHKALDMQPQAPLREPEAGQLRASSSTCPSSIAPGCRVSTPRAAQFLEPLFEYSGACAGCGETPVHQAAHPAVRRPAADRQRHRLLVDLRRQPADHAVHHRPRTAAGRRGRTRCSRTTPSSASASASRSTRSATTPRCCCASWQRRSATSWPRRCSPAPTRATRRRSPRSASASRCCASGWRAATAPVARALEAAGRLPGAQERLAGRRRRLGLRHRLRRPRPRPRPASRRQRAGARHRGLLEHRRPAVEGDPARRRGQVRQRRQGDGEEGPRHGDDELRPRLRRPGRVRRQGQPGRAGLRRGRRLPGPVADHRLQPVHRARLRPARRRRAAEASRWTAASGRSTASTRAGSRPASRRCSSTARRRSVPVDDYMRNETRFRMVERLDPVRFKQLAAAAQHEATQRFAVYQQLAGVTLPRDADDEKQRSDRWPVARRLDEYGRGYAMLDGRPCSVVLSDVGPPRRKGRQVDLSEPPLCVLCALAANSCQSPVTDHFFQDH